MATVIGTQILPPTKSSSDVLISHLMQGLQNRMQQSRMNRGLSSLLGNDTAAAISQLPPQLAGPAIQQAMKLAERNKAMQSLASMYGLGPSIQQTAPTSEAAPQGISSALGQPTAEQMPGTAPTTQTFMPQQSPMAQSLGGYQPGQQALTALAMGADMGTALKLEQDARNLARKEMSELRKENIAEQREIDKETLPYYRDVLKEYKGAKENERRLMRMENLVRKGDLDSPAFSSLMDTISKGIFGFGINLDALRSPDSQEFKKLSTEFLKNAKNLFGNRVTDNEIKLFMQMVPTLNQSDKGKLRVINNMRAYNQAEMLKKQAMDEIIKENGGRRPRNIEMLVEERIGPQLDALAERFQKGFNISEEPEVDKSSITAKMQPGIFGALGNIAEWLGNI